MKKNISLAAIILLLINGISACYGGLNLMIEPSGRNLGLSTDKLLFLPFETYLVPGILLLALNGISSLIIAGLVNNKKRHAGLFVILQGVVLIGWILIQANAVPNDFIQIFFGTIAILLICLGVVLSRLKTVSLLS